jgi:hypothetical protein
VAVAEVSGARTAAGAQAASRSSATIEALIDLSWVECVADIGIGIREENVPARVAPAEPLTEAGLASNGSLR